MRERKREWQRESLSPICAGSAADLRHPIQTEKMLQEGGTCVKGNEWEWSRGVPSPECPCLSSESQERQSGRRVKPEQRHQQVLRIRKKKQDKIEIRCKKSRLSGKSLSKEKHKEQLIDRKYNNIKLVFPKLEPTYYLSQPPSLSPLLVRILLPRIIAFSSSFSSSSSCPPPWQTKPPWKPGAPGRYSSLFPYWTPTWTQRQLNRWGEGRGERKQGGGRGVHMGLPDF